MTFKAEQRLRSNYSYSVSYTLSTSKDDASSPGATEAETNFPQNVRNIFDETGEWARFELRPSSSVRGERHVSAAVLRRCRRAAEGVLGGWRVNAVFFAQSGAPFTVNLGVDQANIGAVPRNGPINCGMPNLPSGERRPERWFDTSAFALPAPFSFGNAPRNSVIGPGFANLDLAVAKTWTVAGRGSSNCDGKCSTS